MKNQDSNTARLSKQFLNEIRKFEKDEALDTLINILESTIDPDPSEMYLLESLNRFQEKMKMVESRIDSYLKKKQKIEIGDKLDNLYCSEAIGTSKLFRY